MNAVSTADDHQEERFVVVRAPALVPPPPRQHVTDVELVDDPETFRFTCACGVRGGQRETSELALQDAHVHVAVSAEADTPPEPGPDRWLVLDGLYDDRHVEHSFSDRREADEYAATLNRWYAAKPKPGQPENVETTGDVVTDRLLRVLNVDVRDNADAVLGHAIEDARLQAQADDEIAAEKRYARREAARDVPGWPVEESPWGNPNETCDECGDPGELRDTRSGQRICLLCIASYPERGDHRRKDAPWAPAVQA